MTELRGQLVSALLVVVTVAAVICAAINYQQQRIFRLPDDGVVWVQTSPDGKAAVVEATHIVDDSPAERAGIKAGDAVKSIGVLPVGSAKYQGVPIEKPEDVAAVLSSIGAFRDAQYVLEREGVQFSAKVILGEAARDAALYSQYAVGIAYLAIGIFLYFRRSRAPMSLHFYLLCLVSFILHTFHYTGKLNGFDTAIYIGNLIAGYLAPALFLHFCLSFPEPLERRLPVTVLSVYLPAVTLMALQLGVATGVVRTSVPLTELRWLIDRAWLLLFAICYLGGGALLHFKCRAADDPIVRKQLKWLRNGTLAAFIPFTFLYAMPYAFGVVPEATSRLAVLFLGFLPLTWAYAILRYRLMDVDVIFQQGYVYVLATVGVLGVVYALVYALAKRDELSPSAVVLLVLVAVFIFQPLRNWTQELLDRYVFYKDQYDYRRTLIDFARELSSEMDLDRTFSAVGERLIRTLSLAHVAFFLESDERPGEVDLRVAVAKEGRRAVSGEEELDLSFLKLSGHMPYLFFERTRHAFDVVSREAPPSVRATIARLDLTYYLPCIFRGRTLAWLGVSRTAKGDFLASDDLELLMTLSNYVAMAVENARLYRSLADKAAQYERLKEFSENIVESINVGILAADLDDRVESWNSQIERLTGIPRVAALGRTLSELFPRDWQIHLARHGESERVLQMYKVPLPNFQEPDATAADRLVNVAITPLVTKDGEQIGRLIIFDDVTEREDLQRRLVQADKLSSIGLLAAGVAHEVNTPLAVISTYAQMLAKQVNGDDQKAKLLDKIAKQTFRASEIVNSLLNFSRTSTSDFDDVDLNKVVRETATLLEHQFRKAGVEVVMDLDDQLPMIRGNFGRLQQVFLNLFLNARDAMESGGRLTVESRTSSGNPRLEVRDTGPGIPPDLVNRIFDPFFTTKTAKKGTGLGLSISYGIVEEHGGSIEAAASGGPGAVFRLEFPAVQKVVNA